MRNERDRMLQENNDIGRDKSDADAEKLRLKVISNKKNLYSKLKLNRMHFFVDGAQRSEISRNTNDGRLF